MIIESAPTSETALRGRLTQLETFVKQRTDSVAWDELLALMCHLAEQQLRGALRHGFEIKTAVIEWVADQEERQGHIFEDGFIEAVAREVAKLVSDSESLRRCLHE